MKAGNWNWITTLLHDNPNGYWNLDVYSPSMHLLHLILPLSGKPRNTVMMSVCPAETEDVNVHVCWWHLKHTWSRV